MFEIINKEHCHFCKHQWIENNTKLILFNPAGGYGMNKSTLVCIYCLKAHPELHDRAIEVCNVDPKDLI